MRKYPGQKLRLLHVMRYLQEESDELHSVTLSDIAEELKKFDISCDRKSLYEAIASNRQVSFKYFEYTLSKTMCFRRNGHVYQVSPYALHWDGDNYYLIAHSDEHGMTHFRVDKTFEVSICDEERRLPDANLDIVKYVQQSFSMFGGDKDTVTIHFANELVGVVIDRFGKDIVIQKVDEQHFSAEVQANISSTFLSWIFQFAGKARIIAPASVVARMKGMIDEIKGWY